jgi:protein involved in polysaccharide export with SLBB domain
MRNSAVLARLLIVAVVFVIAGPAGVSAQQRTTGRAPPDTVSIPPQIRALGTGVSNRAVTERLRQSGMTRSQMRAALQRLGYDPGLADRYYDVIEGRASVAEGDVDRGFLEAMSALGVPAVAHSDELDLTSPWVMDSLLVDSLRLDSLRVDSLAADSSAYTEPRLYGLDLFRRFTTQFDSPLSGPVDPDYVLGPGDELSLVLTGEVESSWAFEVTREGFVMIPAAGQVFVSGLTMTELEDRLFDVLGRHYSGIRRDANSPIRFHVGLRRLRTSAVYVIGETVQPGAYQVSSVATVLNALYLAGGPTEKASFRQIEVRRNGQVVDTLDLYDYLMEGDTRNDVRLQHGDVVFMPIAGPRVTIEGAVRRPAIYEMREDEGLERALSFAGGLASDAAAHRVQIDRILPPSERSPGIDRVLIDVDATRLAAGEGITVRDGDVVRVFGVRADRRNRVTVTGEVNRPGVYEWRDGLTLADLIDRAGGLGEQAYEARTHVFRLSPRDGSRHLLRVDPDQFAVTPLMDRDSVILYDITELATPQFVSIDGFVKEPGAYELARGMTLQDLVLAAGGFVQGAYTVEAELARSPSTSADASNEGSIVRVRLGGSPDPASAGVIEWRPDAEEVRLEHGDRVYIRKAPAFEAPRSITVAGEVLFPGAYAITEQRIRVSAILERAGGPKPEAYLTGAQLVRDGHLVATDIAGAVRAPGGKEDVELLAGDSINVPRMDATVLVRGAIGFETRVRYEQGRGLDYYVDRAGGYTDNADRGRVTVTELNGERRLARVRRFFFDSKPDPGPGATVFVPAEPPSTGGVNWDTVITRLVGIASATATVIIAVNQVK